MRTSLRHLYPITPLRAFVARHLSVSNSDRLLTADTPSAVLLSNSRCIYDNLAAEEALLRGVVLMPHQQYLFMYVNNPCVVIGRNQNFLQEVAVRAARRDDVVIARRASGGGAVYHDTGNLCLSFFTHRDGYAPHKTIQIVRHFLCAHCGISPERLTTTGRHDLFLDGKKITGSAMRVQRDVAYHHCTLLISSSRARLGSYLHSEGEYIRFTSASPSSVRSPVTTLQIENVLPPKGLTDTAHETVNENEDAVGRMQHALADYFLMNADATLSHSAPWEMTPPASGTAGNNRRSFGHCICALDVAAAVRLGEKIVDGEGRRPASGSAVDMREESTRLQTTDWLFAMPKFETVVSVSAENIEKTCGGKISRETVSHLMSARETLEITTIVERGVVTTVSAAKKNMDAVDPNMKDTENLWWCKTILKTLLEGTRVEAFGDLRGNDALLTAALERECFNSVDAHELMGMDTSLLSLLRAVLDIWATKNAFNVLL